MALFGVSYDAGAAVRAAAQQHPAVKAKLLPPVDGLSVLCFMFVLWRVCLLMIVLRA